MEHASRVFITTDLTGQVYFCYLISSQCSLFLVRLERSNDADRMILGMVTTMSAKDAINLPVSFIINSHENEFRSDYVPPRMKKRENEE